MLRPEDIQIDYENNCVMARRNDHIYVFDINTSRRREDLECDIADIELEERKFARAVTRLVDAAEEQDRFRATMPVHKPIGG